MIRLLIPILLATFAHSKMDAQAVEPFLHEFKKGKTILLYSYAQRRDSTFLTGYLKEKGGQPLLNMNITVKGFPIGTVPDTNGNFRIFLPVKEGVIIFDKTNYAYFEFPYKYRREDQQKPTAHH